MKKAVVKVGGKQFSVSEKETLLVDLLPQGTKELKLDALMLIDGDKVEVGTPTVNGVKVSAKVVDELVKLKSVYIKKTDIVKNILKLKLLQLNNTVYKTYNKTIYSNSIN